MAREVIVEPGQCMEDIALQEYGTVDGVNELLLDNLDVFEDGFSSSLMAGTKLKLRDEPINREVYQTGKKLRVIPATAPAEEDDEIGDLGDYNNDYNNDHFINA